MYDAFEEWWEEDGKWYREDAHGVACAAWEKAVKWADTRRYVKAIRTSLIKETLKKAEAPNSGETL